MDPGELIFSAQNRSGEWGKETKRKNTKEDECTSCVLINGDVFSMMLLMGMSTMSIVR